jgi:hypothetical protein
LRLDPAAQGRAEARPWVNGAETFVESLITTGPVLAFRRRMNEVTSW